MTNSEAIQARMTAIYLELAALDSTKPGGLPNSSGGGDSIDHIGYKDALYRELEKLRELLPLADGCWEHVS